MASENLIAAVKYYEDYIKKYGITDEVIENYVNAATVAIKTESDIEYGLKITERIKTLIDQKSKDVSGVGFWDLEHYAQDNDIENVTLIEKYYETLKLESYYSLESFMFFMEKNRNWKKRFYYPRRKTLHIVTEDLEDLENRKIKFYGLSMPPRTGKSSTCIFFLAWIALRRPNSHNAMGGHSGILAKGFYKELMNLITSEEYTFAEMYYFWNQKYERKAIVTDKSADEFTITLGTPDRFATVTCRGIDGTWTGAVDVSKDGYLYVDDLIRDREHSLSPVRMENTYQEYLNKMDDRKNDGARELMVGTLWNVLDPLERMRVQYEGNPEYRFRKIPALDENDESNFDYEINGFSTAYYRDMREKLDRAEWMAKFQQQPYVREGLLFPGNELRYFDGNIPENLEDKERRVIAVCDPAFGGADSLSMPVCMDFDNKDKFIIGWVFKKGTQAVTVPLIVDAVEKHYITELHIEQNAGGKLLSDSIRQEMNRRGIMFCHIVPYYAPVKMPKAEKIKGFSDSIKERFLFIIENRYLGVESSNVTYKRSKMYQDAMNELEMYTSEGKNAHDDAPDSLSQLAMIFGKKSKQARIIQSPI